MAAVKSCRRVPYIPVRVNSVGIQTHVMEFSSGRASTKDGGSRILQFVSPLRQLDGVERWFITFYALPEGKDYEEVRDAGTPEYLQAGGRADKMMLDIRKLGGQQWGAESVRYIIGHPGGQGQPLDVAIDMPKGPEYVSAAEVFEAEEAGEIFFAYYKTGGIPPGYVLRPVEGYSASGDLIDMRSAAFETS